MANYQPRDLAPVHTPGWARSRALRPALGSLPARRHQARGREPVAMLQGRRDLGGAIKMGVIIVNGERCLKTGNMRQQLVVIFRNPYSLRRKIGYHACCCESSREEIHSGQSRRR
jgi:hypothetical protein